MMTCSDPANSNNARTKATRTVRIKMLDYLHRSRRVISFNAPVPVGLRAMQQLDVLFLMPWHNLRPEPARRILETDRRHVDPDNLLECPLRQQTLQQLTRDAAKIHRTARTEDLQFCRNGIKPKLMQPDGSFLLLFN